MSSNGLRQFTQGEGTTTLEQPNQFPVEEGVAPVDAEESFLTEMTDILGTKSSEVLDMAKGYIDEAFSTDTNLFSEVAGMVGEEPTVEQKKTLGIAPEEPKPNVAPSHSNGTGLSFDEIKGTSSNHARYIKVLGLLEGVENHVDTVGIGTNAYGVVNDMANHPSATKTNRKIAKELGVDLDKATPEQSKQVAIKLIEKSEKHLAKKVPNWNKLNDSSKSFMIDFHYNGGTTAVALPIALEKYQDNPSESNLKKVGKESRRHADGKRTKGLDNRVARIMRHLGMIDTLREARKYGLPLAAD